MATPKARWLEIDGRHRRPLSLHANLADFTVGATRAADPQLLLDRPELSLYCLDHEQRQAIFVELPPGLDLTAASFVYMTQYEEAVRLLAVPFDRFLEIAGSLPPLDRFITIYMTGRSGSTVLTRAFNELDGVVSLSEPDTPVSLAHHWPAQGERRTELEALLDASLRILFRTPTNRMPTVGVLKLRNESIRIAELFEAVVPQARNLFSYRDAVGFVASMYRIAMRLGMPQRAPLSGMVADLEASTSFDVTHLLPYLGEGGEEVPITWQFLLWWLSAMEGYLKEHERGFPMLPLRFDELTNRREGVLERVFEHCDLGDLETSVALTAFGADSQGGTILARERSGEEAWRLSARQVDEIATILARHPVITTSDFVVPGAPGGVTP